MSLAGTRPQLTTGARGWWLTRGVATALPGDLAVWDGHVAMIVGNGIIVEAGNQ